MNEPDNPQIDDRDHIIMNLSMLVIRLTRRVDFLSEHHPVEESRKINTEITDQAREFLRRHGLQGSVLR